MEYVTLDQRESFGSNGGFGLKIMVAASSLPDLTHDAIRSAVYDVVDKLSSAIQGVIKSGNPETAKEIERNREIVDLFLGPIFVEEIPNGYCGSWCCKHLPWFVVTTTAGRIKIGWRKRVISIDWSETVNTGSSFELFEAEDVTKGDKSIHAWSMEKAGQYLTTIISSGRH